MNLKTCYQSIDGNFDGVLERLGSEGFVKRMAIRFLDDPSFQMIRDGIDTKDAELAFRGAHTLKGVCANLGFDRLYELSSQLTECLRGRDWSDYEELFTQVERQYQKTIDAIRTLDP